ncbi:MAG: SDR family oxidoreductase [Acaryochloridaceae cyanobacterium SU_2_1]|nr:SDR family oxidoreductase [Acaryochloridaceae cyanobacterium SU_2_1]NJM95197.1 SDR family oxidoreductase [Acaryochloridaceae cyanobacterium CSU_5_19]
MDFEQRHAIITGGSSGIGKATACRLASLGAQITIIARNPNQLALAVQDIEAARATPQQQVIGLSADVADHLALSQAINDAIAQIGPPDLLITAAGIAHPGYFGDIGLDVFERTMAVNYFGSLYALKTVLPIMQKRHQGHLVLLSSGAGLIGLFGYTPYSPSKFALRGLAESLRGELRHSGVGLSIVYPPDTDTPQLQAENRTKPQETKAITATAALWSAEQVAQTIIKGIQRQQFVITPGVEMTLLAKLHSILAPALNGYFDRIVARTQAKMLTADAATPPHINPP